ncbi:MAG: FkbM family methyltransferase [Alphaproteobacteria bacterium]|nr:FkbM family methyltransferase [Alphaproteobacteria bacterium]
MSNTAAMAAEKSSRIGRWLAYRFDRLGSWLLLKVPSIGRIYTSAIRGRAPRLGVVPGWRYAHECYPPSPWWVMRRRALWQCALDHQLDVPVVVPWLAGTHVGVTLGNNMSLFLYVCGSYEPNEFAFLDHVLRPDMTVVDIGANEGLYTLFAAQRVGTSGRVIAIEPSSRERSTLDANLARSRMHNVVVVPHALADSPGMAELKIAPRMHGGHNTLGQFFDEGDTAVSYEKVTVETLDALGARLGLSRVDVVKIDVEGAEMKLLSGGRSLLLQHRPILLVEANDEALKRQGASAAALVDLLLSLDYQIHVFNETGTIEPWTQGRRLSENIVALTRESR